jgi:hypothetical protein
MGDLAACGSSTDAIDSGTPTVLIGPLPAARQGDSTARGGVIVGGEPTVLIGAAAQESAFEGAREKRENFCAECASSDRRRHP